MRHFLFVLLCTVTLGAFSQTPIKKAPAVAKPAADKLFMLMPFNRLIQSAGKVVTYGNPQLENHTLDVVPMPGGKTLMVEDRYGIALVNAADGTIKSRWAFEKQNGLTNAKSTYSGIKTFTFNNATYAVWGAADSRSYIMIAQCNNDEIIQVDTIQIAALRPATNALPNEIAVNMESGIPYLYTVLNGNNQLVKINFTSKQIVWQVPTGMAPFGIKILGGKAYVTNWAGPVVTDSLRESAGIPWGSAYINPVTGATSNGSLSVIDISNGKLLNELTLGLHPNAIMHSINKKYLFIANGNSDYISVVDIAAETVVDSIFVGLFSKGYKFFGSSPNGLCADVNGQMLYVANGLDNAVAVVRLGKYGTLPSQVKPMVAGFIPTEAYPSGIAQNKNRLFVTNLEAKGARVLSATDASYNTAVMPQQAYTIHKQLASFSIIPIPEATQLSAYTKKVMELNMVYRLQQNNLPSRKGVAARPLPERIGEPSVFKHVVYIIKENKTYDQVFGDVKQGRGDADLCIYGEQVTPNQHALAKQFVLLDNYYASGKSSAEGHQWTDASMVSDYIEKNVRAWFRSYPHRQTDALVYNKSGFIWNNALDNGKTVRIYGEACTTHYDPKLNWFDIYRLYQQQQPIALTNTSTISRVRPIISPGFPDCDNLIFPDQLRAQMFINEWKKYEESDVDSLPNLLIISLPNDHTAGTSPNFPTPRAMVADNDLALGRIIEAITHSRFWDSTVVFVTEDDSQSGWDHISSYRTVCQVISPYSNLQKNITTNYNQTSMVRTIEQILGIPPMNVIDATALPMFDCFAQKPTPIAYTAVPNKIPLDERNKPFSALTGKALKYAKLSAEEVFKDVDGGEDDEMNEILWFDAKGLQKYPGKKDND